MYAVVCYRNSIKGEDANSRVEKMLRKAGSVLGTELKSLKLVTKRKMLFKLSNITNNPSHPLQYDTSSHP